MRPVNLLKIGAVLLSLGGVVPAASAQMMAGPGPMVMPADYEFVAKAAYGGGGGNAPPQGGLPKFGGPRHPQLPEKKIAGPHAPKQGNPGAAPPRRLTP